MNESLVTVKKSELYALEVGLRQKEYYRQQALTLQAELEKHSVSIQPQGQVSVKQMFAKAKESPAYWKMKNELLRDELKMRRAAHDLLVRCVEEHLDAYTRLNINDDPAREDVLLADIQQTYRNMRDAIKEDN